MGQSQSYSKGSRIIQNEIAKSSSNINNPISNKGTLDNFKNKVTALQSYKKISNYKLELMIEGHLQNLQFITKEPIKNVSNYSGYAKILNKQQIKIFQGQFKNSKRNGYGIQYDLQGNKSYEGYFVNGVYQGWGISLGYQGQFKNGKRQGYGIYEELINQKQSLVYQGYWKNDKFHGIGTLNVKANQIPAFIIAKELENFKNSDTIKYVGQWQAGALSGIGKLVRKKQIYSGQFENGEFHGQGTIYYQTGERKKGFFERGIFVKANKK